MDRVERLKQLVDDDPVEQAVVGDLTPERRHQPHGVGVVQNRVAVPSPVVGPDPGRERRRTADPCSARPGGSTRHHAQSIQGRHGTRFVGRPRREVRGPVGRGRADARTRGSLSTGESLRCGGARAPSRRCTDARVDAERRIEAPHPPSGVVPGLRRELEHLLNETVDAGVTPFVWLRQFEPGSIPLTPTGCWTASERSDLRPHQVKRPVRRHRVETPRAPRSPS